MSTRKLLDPSELGTKGYWDNIYARELENNQHDAEDEGTVWFEESNAEQEILKLLAGLDRDHYIQRTPGRNGESHANTNARSQFSRQSTTATLAARFLDLGTGNGHLLFALREEDDDGESWSGDLVGVDYSESSIELARRLVDQKQLDNIQFETWNLLTEAAGPWVGNGFEVVLDKGTFDAISLMPASQESEQEAHPCDVYREKVTDLVRLGGFLCITSCNWTKDELVSWLEGEQGQLKFFAEAAYPTFTFGGSTGQSIVTLLFRKVLSEST